MRRFLLLCLPVLIFTTAIHAGAQSTDATLSGVVVDPAGKVIHGADVEILNEATGVRYSGTTNEAGIYAVTILPPGQYRIQVSKVGFKTLIKPGITLSVQDAMVLNFTLPIGAASESVTVEGGASAINTTDGSVSTVIDHEFVENMPLNGRSFQDLLSLAPGVFQVPTSVGVGYGVGYSGDIVVNGQRTESNYFTVDGVSANTGAISGGAQGGGVSGNLPQFTTLGTTQGLASIDDLQEFRSNTSSYSAEYGRSPGGQFSFSTRSGTDTLHGSLYDFLRNDALDANNWFNNFYGFPKGRERQNDFGGTVGGPIVLPRLYNGRKRSFFFLAYEGLRLTAPQAATEVEVPDNTLRSQAPAALQPLLNSFPVENGGSDGKNDGFGNYIESVSYPSNLNNTSIRVDHTMGSRLTLFGRYADTPTTSSSYNGADEEVVENRTQSATFGATSAITEHQSNDLRYNFTHNGGSKASIATNLGGAIPFSVSSLPGPGGAAFPQDNSDLYVVFNFARFTNVALNSFPQIQDQWNLTDTHSWILGKHNIKAGIDWRTLRTTLYTIIPTEEISFRNETQVLENTPGFGYVTTSGLAGDNQPVYDYFSAFVQDEWKVTPRLSLSTGLRWDLSPAPGNANGPAPYTVTQAGNLATTQLAPRGTPLWNTDWTGFAPRIGAAFQIHPGSSRNTVVRAGFGVFYDPGNSQGSAGYIGIGFSSAAVIPAASFPLTSAQLTLPPPSVTAPYSGYIFGFDPNLRLPYSFQYNFAVEQSLSTKESVTLGYVGSGARKLLTTFQTVPAKLGNQNFSSNATLELTQGRASSSYNSLQVKYQREIHHGLQALVSYTWAHSIDSASSNFGIFSLLRASSDFDIRHNLEAALTYLTLRIPSSHAIARVLDNWGIDSRLQARTALPIDVIGNLELSPGTGTYLQYQPNLVSGQPLYLSSPSYPGGRAINYDAFALPPNGVEGDLPRNYARAFGLIELDTAIRREFPIHDRTHLQVRAEAFNLFNHPDFGPVYNYLVEGPELFGQAYNTANIEGNLNSLYQPGGPRSLQIALKFLF